MKKLLDFFKNLIVKERCPHRFALAFCLGNFIAFSPFIGLHTIMVFVCAWAFGLSLPVMLTVSMAINNVWTLVPIYASDYIFGYWLSHSFLKLNFTSLNQFFLTMISWLPALLFEWVHDALRYTTNFFQETLSMPKPCLWSFLIGGNILGLVTSLLLYPIIKRLFIKIIAQIDSTKPL